MSSQEMKVKVTKNEYKEAHMVQHMEMMKAIS
jgi:hypothetical protein